jgi:hypothetical protein
MIDLNYLGHKLKPYYDIYPEYDYKCEICNIILFINIQDKYHQANYCICSGDSIDDKCTLTCEEYIIKSIIE